MDGTIYIIAEHTDGKVSPITFELAAFAEQISKITHLPIEMVILGHDIDDIAEKIAESTGLNINILDIPGLNYYSREIYIRALADFFSRKRAALICVANSARGTDFAPGLAVQLNAANITSVQDIGEHAGELCFLRPTDSGKRIAHISPLTDTVILNIQPGIFKALKHKPSHAGSLSTIRMEYTSENSRFLGVGSSKTDVGAISQAEVIVAVGNGIKDGEKLDLIHRFADLFHKSAVAGSRIVCDKGLLSYGQQVGITGAIVAPKLYIACGISGSSQHVAGMIGSEFIVAINTDSDAPIINVADVCAVEDMITFIPILIDIFNKLSDSKEKYHG